MSNEMEMAVDYDDAASNDGEAFDDCDGVVDDGDGVVNDNVNDINLDANPKRRGRLLEKLLQTLSTRAEKEAACRKDF